MTVHHIVVGVATQRPPMIDEFRRYAIEADTERDATLVALWMSSRASVMPVWIGWVEDVPHLDESWIR